MSYDAKIGMPLRQIKSFFGPSFSASLSRWSQDAGDALLLPRLKSLDVTTAKGFSTFGGFGEYELQACKTSPTDHYI